MVGAGDAVRVMTIHGAKGLEAESSRSPMLMRVRRPKPKRAGGLAAGGAAARTPVIRRRGEAARD